VLNPTAYTNAILINLHGELFPFAPTRNYSDPAKAPDTTATSPNDLRNIRVVTHPEMLTYVPGDVNNPDVKLRVYAYEAPNGSSSIASGVLPVPVTVVIPGIDLTSSGTVTIQRVEGGVAPTIRPSGDNTPSTGNGYVTSDALVTPCAGNRMCASVASVTVSGVPNTVITLVRTPFRHPVCSGSNCASAEHTSGVTTNAGLAAGNYLYNQQYIPAPMENFASSTAQTPFALDLDSNTTGPKNTARWIITINGPNLTAALNAHGLPAVGGIPACSAPCTNTALEFETRIGDAPSGTLPSTGTMWPVRNQPPNLSRTYTWRGTNVWLYGDGTNTNPPHLPMTERYQFMGDPRHCPYADLKKPHTTAGGAHVNNVNTNLGMGYNKNFDDFENASTDAGATWPGWTYTVGGNRYGVRNGDGNTTNDGESWGTRSGGPSPGQTQNGEIELDVQRAFQTLRNALTSAQAIYTTMTGWSYYYIGIGGEI
ncbi:MAG: hypothetical protein ACRD3J_15605, partial [Thermoanaerobaculia bacterium]